MQFVFQAVPVLLLRWTFVCDGTIQSLQESMNEKALDDYAC